jgi:opacity protein-like surface antigen
MKSAKLILAALLLLVVPMVTFAQKYWEIGATGGVMNYYGDLTAPAFTLREIHAAGQVSARRYFDRQHALRFNLMHGVLSGNDQNFDRNYLRGNSFVGRLTEFSMMGEVDLKGRKRFSKKFGYQKMASPYLFIGASLAYFNPKVSYGPPNSPDEDIDYIDWHVGMPLGAGIRFDVNEKVTINMELNIHFTLSDYLDGTQASGNAYRNDSYSFFGVGAGYRFFEKVEIAPAEKPAQK